MYMLRGSFGNTSYFSTFNNQPNTELLMRNIIRDDIPANILNEINPHKFIKVLDMMKSEQDLECVNELFGFYNETNLIKEVKIKSGETPNYIYNDGVETIIYYDYKKSGKYREMSIPNFIYYMSFVYNSILVRETLFNVIYRNDDINFSTSEILNKDIEYFLLDYGEFIDYEFDFKDTSQNKNISRRLERDQLSEATYLYYLTTDIESYYSNIYSHNFNLIGNKSPFNKSPDLQDYIKFLDIYNMKINNNQTKGIITGPQSSSISSEVLGLYLDGKIKEIIKDQDVQYIRHVDDMTFYSNDLTLLEVILKEVQSILHENRLTIKEEKTKIQKGFKERAESNIFEIFDEFPYMRGWQEDAKILQEHDFYKLRKYIEVKMSNHEFTQIKTLLSLLKKNLQEFKIGTDSNITVIFINYFLKLGYLNNVLQLWIYKTLKVIMIRDFINKEKFISILSKNTTFINDMHHNTITQIWHYHIFNQLLNEKEQAQELDNLIEFYKMKINITEINPLVLIEFIKVDSINNTKIFEYILETYKRKGENFEQTVAHSKWWIVLISLRYKGKFKHKELDKLFRNKQWKIVHKKLGIFELLFKI